MSLWIDDKYARLLSSSVRNFKRTDKYKYQFSCPLCGDSKKDATKARGYLYAKGQKMAFYCWNGCGGATFNRLLKTVNPYLHRQYITEKYVTRRDPAPIAEPINDSNPFEIVKEQPKNIFDSLLIRCDLLDANSIAIQYLKSRQIDESYWNVLYSCDDINILKTVFTNYEDKEFVAEPRLVIPVYDKQDKLNGAVTRAFLPESKLRYVNFKTELEEEKLIYGLHDYDPGKKIIVVEGIFDSMFPSNAIACNTMDFSGSFQYLVRDRDVLVYDNTPRNHHLINAMLKSVDLGFNVCVWPKWIMSKDINDMIKSKEVAKSEIDNLISENTYNGLTLKLKINSWKQI